MGESVRSSRSVVSLWATSGWSTTWIRMVPTVPNPPGAAPAARAGRRPADGHRMTTRAEPHTIGEQGIPTRRDGQEKGNA
ncbi:hypothetical protein GCM10027160_04540 [Streptomyces calidiresistens]